MPSTEASMAARELRRAGRTIEAAIAARGRWWRPWGRGLWATARTSYAPRPLAAAFEQRVVALETGGGARVRRRVAVARGSRPALLIVPGLYASLDEGLFSHIAELALAKTGRSVVLVEDRLAGPTLALNRGEVPRLRQMADELAAIVATLDARPDALALSAGAAVALAAAERTFERIVAWSAAVDIGAVARQLGDRPLLRRYYERVHCRAFASAGVAAPPLGAVQQALASDHSLATPHAPLLLLHAARDPVAPLAALAPLARHPGVIVHVLQAGGHLGFGAVAGPEIYVAPFVQAPSSSVS
ncbi:MAG: hypothetical protein KC503_12795 [Myxococcales bacterium]|nr:hypothetical protein [Myxococcales bacterium]